MMKRHLLAHAFIKADQRFGAPASVLGAAEGKKVHTGFPGHFRRGDIHGRQRIGKTCSVHVQRNVVRLRYSDEFPAISSSEYSVPISVDWVRVTAPGLP